jgi:hypothetical protein
MTPPPVDKGTNFNSNSAHHEVNSFGIGCQKRGTLYCRGMGSSGRVQRNLTQGWSRLGSGFVRPCPALLHHWSNEGRIKSAQACSKPGATLDYIAMDKIWPGAE